MTENKKLAIVIPVFNRKQITIDCLANLEKNDFQDYKVFVCDSGSNDGTQEAVLNFEKVELVHVGSHAWWSAAVNQGVLKALGEGFESYLILNDDISFQNNLINQLLSKHSQYPNYIISPIQESPTGLFMGTIYSGLFKKPTNLTIDDFTDDDQVVDTTNGCCLLIPRLVFEKVGLFNENQCPHLYGDTEFQLRAKQNRFYNVVCKNIVIVQNYPTDYFKRVNPKNLFTFNGSPLHINSYLSFGQVLFEGKLNFYILGIYYHLNYARYLLKALILISIK